MPTKKISAVAAATATAPAGSITLPTYSLDPTFLLDPELNLSPVDREAYRAIYRRLVALSIPNADRYRDENGDLYVIYTNDDLARVCGISISTTKKAKKTLRTKGLIEIKPIPGSRAVRIYPMYPVDAPTFPFRYNARNASTATSTGAPATGAAVTTTSVTNALTHAASHTTFDTETFFDAAVRRSLGQS